MSLYIASKYLTFTTEWRFNNVWYQSGKQKP